MEKNLDQGSTFGVKHLTIKKAVFKQVTKINPVRVGWAARPKTHEEAYGTLMGWVNDENGKLEGFICKMPNNTLAFIHYDHLVEALVYFMRQLDPNRNLYEMQTEAKDKIAHHQNRLLQVFVA